MNLPIKTCVVTILILCLSAVTSAESEKGPLRVSNQFPPHLMFLSPTADSPRLIPRNRSRLSFSADYSSIFVNETSGEWSALIDMEMTVLGFSLECGVTDDLNLSFDLPLVSMNRGVLDGFLEDYHQAFGFPNSNRESRPKNAFAYALKKEGHAWFRADSGGLHLSDSLISAKLFLMDEKAGPLPTALSLSYRLKLPTGDEGKGFGSGAFDHGLSLNSLFRVGSFVFYLTPSITFLSDPKTSGADISVNDLFGMLAGGEYIFSDALSLLAQLNYYTSPFGDTGIRQLDDDTLSLEMGGVYRLTPSLSLEFAFCEDLTHSAPDFNLHTRLIYEMGN